MKVLNQEGVRDVRVGNNVKIFGVVNLYECAIGDNSKVGAFVEIQRDVLVGKNCKVSSHSFLCTGVTLEDEVFIGHGVMFTNDMHPSAVNADGSVQTAADWKLLPTLVKRGASIGSNATILPGITIGEGAIVGAGAVVTKDVPAHATVVGNPARLIED